MQIATRYAHCRQSAAGTGKLAAYLSFDCRRISSGQDALLEALVTGVTAGVEVVLVQDKNSFFAYRPILAALQVPDLPRAS